MRITRTAVALATGLVMTAGGSVAAAEPGSTGHQPERSAAPSAAASVTDQGARKCIGKKKVRRARVFVSVKRLNRILGKKGTYWAGTYRVWDVCFSSYDLSAYVVKKKGKLRVFEIEAPPAKSAFRGDAGRAEAESTRGCISKRTIKRKLRPYMTFRKVKKALGGGGAGSSPTSRYWSGCFDGRLKVAFDRVKGKRRVRDIDVVEAS